MLLIFLLFDVKCFFFLKCELWAVDYNKVHEGKKKQKEVFKAFFKTTSFTCVVSPRWSRRPEAKITSWKYLFTNSDLWPALVLRPVACGPWKQTHNYWQSSADCEWFMAHFKWRTIVSLVSLLPYFRCHWTHPSADLSYVCCRWTEISDVWWQSKLSAALQQFSGLVVILEKVWGFILNVMLHNKPHWHFSN